TNTATKSPRPFRCATPPSTPKRGQRATGSVRRSMPKSSTTGTPSAWIQEPYGSRSMSGCAGSFLADPRAGGGWTPHDTSAGRRYQYPSDNSHSAIRLAASVGVLTWSLGTTTYWLLGCFGALSNTNSARIGLVLSPTQRNGVGRGIAAALLDIAA